MEMIHCPYCQELFEQTRRNKQYCCRVCKQRASAKRTGLSARQKMRKRPWTRYKKDHCEKCGFIPVHTCQLDVDHIDGDHSNHVEENLQTLCANCHRLKTFLNKDNH